MEVKINIPFSELLTIVKQLSPTQKAKLKMELAMEKTNKARQPNLTELLLNGPVFTEDQIQTTAETRKSINQWRRKYL